MIKTIVTAAAASALLAGAAYAQTGSASAGATPNHSMPADASQSQTGVPSVDSTRPTGGSLAGSTNMPSGQVNGTANATTGSAADTSTDTAVNGSASATGSASTASTTASAGTSTDASAVVSTQTVTNGPVPDTAENRAKYRPMSRAGRATSPAGN